MRHVLRFFLVAAIALLFVTSASASRRTWPQLGHRHAPAAAFETSAQRLARLQVTITNALQLQPHQVCVLHHALLAQTQPPLPGDTFTQATAPTLTSALAGAISPAQQATLVALPTISEIGTEFEILAVRP